MDNPLNTKTTEFPNGAHERASHITIETIYKRLMNKIGAGQVTNRNVVRSRRTS